MLEGTTLVAVDVGDCTCLPTLCLVQVDPQTVPEVTATRLLTSQRLIDQAGTEGTTDTSPVQEPPDVDQDPVPAGPSAARNSPQAKARRRLEVLLRRRSCAAEVLEGYDTVIDEAWTMEDVIARNPYLRRLQGARRTRVARRMISLRDTLTLRWNGRFLWHS